MAKDRAENKTKSAAVLKSERHEYDSQKNWKHLCSPEKLKAFREETASKKAKSLESPKPKQTVYVKRYSDGKYMKGECPNPTGRPLDGTTHLAHLLAAVRKVESRENKNLLEHFVERAFRTDKVLIAVMKKLIPDLQSISVSPDFNKEMTDETALHIQQMLRV